MSAGDVSVLRDRADPADTSAADQLIELATQRGDPDELRRLAAAGNTTAADQLLEFESE